jgi:alcohol dehydrogenase (NADP+)
MSRGVMGIRAMGGPVLGVTQMFRMQNGLSIPSLGFGTYRVSPDEVGPAVTYAVECGFRHIDCAKIYMNEAAVGAALGSLVSSKKVKREDLFVTSKLWPTDQHPDNVERACRESLDNLKVGYLDLLLIHWPVAWKHTGSFATEEDRRPRQANGNAIVDASVTLEDTWRAMTKLVDLGLVKSIGVSNCNASHIKRIADATEEQRHAPVINQVEFHPACYQSDLRNTNGDLGLLTAAYCPLGMPTRFTPPEYTGVAKDDSVLKPLVINTGFSPARLLLNWNLDNGNVVIVKSTNKDHIRDNAKACRYALGDSVRWLLNHYEDQLQKSQRVINPTDFLGGDEPTPFFEPRSKPIREYKP